MSWCRGVVVSPCLPASLPPCLCVSALPAVACSISMEKKLSIFGLPVRNLSCTCPELVLHRRTSSAGLSMCPVTVRPAGWGIFFDYYPNLSRTPPIHSTLWHPGFKGWGIFRAFYPNLPRTKALSHRGHPTSPGKHCATPTSHRRSKASPGRRQCAAASRPDHANYLKELLTFA